MPSFAKKFYSPLLFDCLFASTGVLSVAGIILDVGRPYPAIVPADPLIKAAALLGTIIAGGLFAVISARWDQKHADDFLFHTLTKSAFIAMFTAFFSLALWEVLFAARLGGVSTHGTIGILIASWSLSYFYTRVRGTRS